jgi:hypothetical protein
VEGCYLDLAHFSAEGHRLVGQALGEKLDEVIAREPSPPADQPPDAEPQQPAA